MGRSKVGRYEVICPIAQGGMASVYAGRLASMAGFERLVAIKIIHEALAEDPAFIKMFLDEARIAAGIHHPNVGEILEVGEDDGLYFMIGELIQGQSLRSLYRCAKMNDVDIPNHVAAYIGSQICLGAHAAHELHDQDGTPLKLIHRDISPRNILVSYTGFTKLIDFGVAWAKGRDGDSGEEAMKGKIGFMSPEQVRGEPPLDRRSDLFSLGIVLYLMIVGEHPFLGRTAVERLNKLIRGHVTPPRQLCPDLDPALEKIVLTALSPKMEDRFESAQQMGQELENYIHDVGAKVGPDTLADLMNRLFAEDKQEQEKLLREYRKKQDQSQSAVPVREEKQEKEEAVKKVSFEEAQSDLAEDVTEVKEGSWNKRRWMWIGGVVAVAAVAVLMLLLPSSEPSSQNTSVGTGVMETEPGSEPAEKEPVRITLDVRPATATVTVDGKALQAGTREIEWPADGASHRLIFSAEGYVETIEQVEANQDTKLSIYLKPVPKIQKKEKTNKRKGSPKRSPKLKRSPYG